MGVIWNELCVITLEILYYIYIDIKIIFEKIS